MGLPAARVGDEVAHSNAMTGLLIGAAVGAALAVAVVATGGLAAVAAGAMIAGGLAGGALAGEYIGEASMGPPTGAIMVGSPNVFINGRPAAMTNIAMALCAKEYGAPQPVAQGAATVFINGMPAARKTDKLVCSAQIIQGSGDVFLDDKTRQTLAIEPEVPTWLNRTLQVVAIGAAVVGFGAAIAAVGFGAATVGLAGGLAGGWLGEKGGRALGEALGLSESATRSLEVGGGLLGGLLGGTAATKAYEGFGTNAQGVPTPNAEEVCTNGCPISMHTGEELLTLEDFTWTGPLALAWKRFYRTAQSGIDLQLGHGWLTPVDEWIERVDERTLAYHDREGRRIVLPLPAPDGHAHQAVEQLRVERRGATVRLSGVRDPDREFALPTGGARCPVLAWHRGGHRIEVVRDDEGRALALRASWGKALVFERAGHRIAALTPARLTPAGWVPAGAPYVRYRYDDAGDLVGVLDRLDHGERYAYDGHLLARRTLATGFSFHFEWDGPGPGARCVRNRGDGGVYDYRFEWQPARGFSRATDSRGGASDYLHDAGGRLLRAIGPGHRTTDFRYDERGLLAEVSGPLGVEARYDYDEAGRLVRTLDAEGRASTLAYDLRGRLAASTDALGATTSWQYDAQGRLVRRTDAAGGVHAWRYNAQGLLVQETNAVGQVRLLWWDAQARVVAEIGFDGVRRYFGHDADDRIRTVTAQERVAQRFEWDAAGRLAACTDAAGRRVTLQRNAAGQLVRWVAPDGATTEYRYREGLSQPSERIDPLGRTLRYEYDTERHLVGLVNAKGERYRLDWDLDGRLVAQVGFDGRERRYRYDAAGRLEARAEASAGGWAVTGLRRDRMGRLVAKTLPEGVTHDFAYDAAGRLVQARTPDHALAFVYDPAGRVVEEHQAGAVVAHTRDALGRPVATRLPDGQTLRYTWNRFGRVEAVLLDGRPVSRHRWDEFAREAEREQGELVTRFEHDPAGRLVGQASRRDEAGAPLIERSYERDARGRLARLHDLRQGDTRYVYDPAGQLVGVQGATIERFVHDPAGNLLGEGDAHADGDRLRMQGDRHFAYDAAGDLVEERRGTGGRLVTRYEYDGQHRLVAAHAAAGTSRYRYDALGRRVAKSTPAGDTHFWWDGALLLGESGTPDVAAARWYVYEPGGFRPLACIERPAAAPRLAARDGRAAPAAAPQIYHYHLDHLGTPREMTDARGRIVWSASYRAFGALALADVHEVANPLRFQGQYHDAETGLHYSLFRYYDPSLGRFVTQDPIGLAGGENLYRYVADPVQWIDPLGLTPCNEVQFQPGRTSDEIVAIPKEQRPDPATYLEQSYIDAHLQTFKDEGGGFLFTPDDIANPNYTSFNPNKFVMAGSDLDGVVANYQATGDVSTIENALGYTPGSLQGKDLYMLKLDNPDVLMPTGNEGGANALWKPGGLTDPGGMREGVLNNVPIFHGNDVANLPAAVKITP